MRIRPPLVVGAAFALVLTLSPSVASAVVDVESAGAERLDVRRASASVRPTDGQLTAVRELVRAAGAGTRVSWDGRFGTPRTIRKDGGWLTGPRSGDAASVARSFIDANRAAFGLSGADVASLTVVRDHELVGTGTHVVNFAQTYDGLPAVRGGRLGVAVTRDGKVLSYAGNSARGGRAPPEGRAALAECWLAQVDRSPARIAMPSPIRSVRTRRLAVVEHADAGARAEV